MIPPAAFIQCCTFESSTLKLWDVSVCLQPHPFRILTSCTSHSGEEAGLKELMLVSGACLTPQRCWQKDCPFAAVLFFPTKSKKFLG